MVFKELPKLSAIFFLKVFCVIWLAYTTGVILRLLYEREKLTRKISEKINDQVYLDVVSIDVDCRNMPEVDKLTGRNTSTRTKNSRTRESARIDYCGEKIGTYRSLSYVLANPVSLTLREQNWCLNSQVAFGLNVIHVEIVAKDRDDVKLEDSTDRVNDKNPLEKLREFLSKTKNNANGSDTKINSSTRAEQTRFMAYVGEIDTKTDIDHVWIRIARLSQRPNVRQIYVIVHLLRDDRRQPRDVKRTEPELVIQLNERFRDQRISFVSYREHKNDIIVLDNKDFLAKLPSENDKRKFYLIRKIELGRLRVDKKNI